MSDILCNATVIVEVPYYDGYTHAFDVDLEMDVRVPYGIAPGTRIVFGDYDGENIVTEVDWMVDGERYNLRCEVKVPPMFCDKRGRPLTGKEKGSAGIGWNAYADRYVKSLLEDGWTASADQEVGAAFWDRPEVTP